jgi:hypothetical protein
MNCDDKKSVFNSYCSGMGVLPLLSHAVLVTLLGVLVEVLVML